MSESKRKIFISYRRDDNADFVERIRDWFVHRYGRENVFMDFDSIPPFTRFADFIKERVRESDVLIAIIGPKWMDLMREKEAYSQEDYVCIEIGLALTESKLIAPICIKGAEVPPVNELPSELREMLNYNVAHLNSGTAFLDNIERIVMAVEQRLADHAKEYVIQGTQKYELGDLDGAIAAFDEALRLNPQSSEAYYGRGRTFWGKNDTDMAIDDFTKAIHLNREYAKAYNDRGYVLQYLKGDLDGAIADFTEAIHLNPKFHDAYYNRAWAHRDKGDLDGAIADYNLLIRLDPQNETWYQDRAEFRYEKGEYEGAVADYTEVIRLDPQADSGYVGRGFMRCANGDLDGAIADYTEAIRLSAENMGAYQRRGEAYFVLGQYENARRDFTHLRQQAPSFPEYLMAQALAIHALGQAQKAIKLWKSLAEQDRRYEDADWVEKNVEWPEPMIEEARKLIASL